MPNKFYTSSNRECFEVLFGNPDDNPADDLENDPLLFRVISIIDTRDGGWKKYLEITVTWDCSDDFGPYEGAIRDSFMTFMERYYYQRIHITIQRAASIDSVNRMFDILMRSSIPAPAIARIIIDKGDYESEVPTAVCMPLLAVWNRTNFSARNVDNLFELYRLITEPRMSPRYISLPSDFHKNDTVKKFMARVHINLYSTFSNTELVTYSNYRVPGVSTVSIMQYMWARREYEKAMLFARVYKYANYHNKEKYVKLPLGYTKVPQPDAEQIEQIWTPQVRIFEGTNNSLWSYRDIWDGNCFMEIDGIELVYTFPVIDMAMSTILDLMESQVEPLDGKIIKCGATFQFKLIDNSTGKLEGWKSVEEMALTYRELGFERVPVYPRVEKTSSWEKHTNNGAGRMYRIDLYLDIQKVVTVAVTYTIVRPRHRITYPRVDFSDIQ